MGMGELQYGNGRLTVWEFKNGSMGMDDWHYGNGRMEVWECVNGSMGIGLRAKNAHFFLSGWIFLCKFSCPCRLLKSTLCHRLHGERGSHDLT